MNAKGTTKRLLAGAASMVMVMSLAGAVASSAAAAPLLTPTTMSASNTNDGFRSLAGNVKNMKGVWVSIQPMESNYDVVKEYVVDIRKGMKLPIKVRLDRSGLGNVPTQEWIITEPKQVITVEGPEGYCTHIFFKAVDKRGKTGLDMSGEKFYYR